MTDGKAQCTGWYAAECYLINIHRINKRMIQDL